MDLSLWSLPLASESHHMVPSLSWSILPLTQNTSIGIIMLLHHPRPHAVLLVMAEEHKIMTLNISPTEKTQELLQSANQLALDAGHSQVG
jgi:shikimate kinase